jgi:hypothetical protein
MGLPALRPRLVAGFPGWFPGPGNPGPNWPGSTYRAVWLYTGESCRSLPRLFPGSAIHESRGRERNPLARSLSLACQATARRRVQAFGASTPATTSEAPLPIAAPARFFPLLPIPSPASVLPHLPRSAPLQFSCPLRRRRWPAVGIDEG